MVTGRRDQTTVAPQALYLLNDPFVRDQSLALAERLFAQFERDATKRDDAERDDLDRIRRAYRLTFCRTPTSHEIDRARLYLSEYDDAQRALLASAETRPSASAATPTTSKATGTKRAANSGAAATPANTKSMAGAGKGAGAARKQAQSPAAAPAPEPVVRVNPDERPRADESLGDEPIAVRDARAAAWASFCQALFGAAEFRYLR